MQGAAGCAAGGGREACANNNNSQLPHGVVCEGQGVAQKHQAAAGGNTTRGVGWASGRSMLQVGHILVVMAGFAACASGIVLASFALRD